MTTGEANRQVALGELSETLMVPLWCRAVETQRRGGLLRDPRAREIVAQLDYDFERRFAAQRGLAFRACLRTVMIDRLAQAFLRRHPGGTVVEVGTGLNTRFERIDDGALRWFDVDLPDALALRRRFFADEPRRTMVAGAFGAADWLARVAGGEGPHLFIVEAVLVYLPEATVRRGLEAIAAAFPGAQIVFDTVTRAAIAAQTRPMMRSFQAPFVWGCDDPREIEAWGAYRRLETSTMFDLPAELARRVPLRHRLALPYLRLFRPELLRSHALHRFELRSADDAA